MKKFKFLIFAGLAIITVFPLFYPVLISAATVTENFNNTTYKDTSATTADWNTDLSRLQLVEEDAGADYRYHANVTSDGSNYYFGFWEGNPLNALDCSRVAKFDSGGNLVSGFGVGGLSICVADYTQTGDVPTLIHDITTPRTPQAGGRRGVYVFLEDVLFGDIWLQRLDADTGYPWWYGCCGFPDDPDQYPYCPQCFTPIFVFGGGGTQKAAGEVIAADDVNGYVYVGGAEYSGADYKLFKFRNDGSIIIDTSRVVLQGKTIVDGDADLATSGDYLYLAWNEGSSNCYVQKYNQSNLLEAWASPVTINDCSGSLSITADSSGNFYLLSHPYGSDDLQIMKYNSNGSPNGSWHGGDPVQFNRSGDEYSLQYGAGQLYAAWRDHSKPAPERHSVRMQKFNINTGAMLFGADGLEVKNLTWAWHTGYYGKHRVAVTVDDSGNALTGYTVDNVSPYIVEAAKVNTSGSVVFHVVPPPRPGTYLSSGTGQSTGYDTGFTTVQYNSFSSSESPANDDHSISYQFSDSPDNNEWSSWTSTITDLSQRYVRWKIDLSTADISITPWVDWIQINYEEEIITGCTIDETYYPDGTYNPNNKCQVCDISQSATSWSNVPGGTDPEDWCDIGSWSCNGLCRRQRNSGDCNGGGACGVNDEKSNCPAGTACSAGSCSSDNYCVTNQCRDGDSWHHKCNKQCNGSNNCANWADDTCVDHCVNGTQDCDETGTDCGGSCSACATAPIVETNNASNIEETTATLNGNITSTGGENADQRGFDWGLTTGYGSSWTESGSYGTGAFSRGITGLSMGTLYHFRAKAHNSAGWGNGSDKTFYTKPGDPSNLNATTQSQTQINLTWSKGSGADQTLIRRKTGSYPSSVSDGAQVYLGSGTSTSNTGLSCGTTYYYRAWAYDSESGYYSDGYSQDNDTTDECTANPTVDSVTISSNPIVVDGSTQYTITIKSSDGNGVGDLNDMRTLINYQGGQSGNYRGYFRWDDSALDSNWNQTGSCSGGGYYGKYNGTSGGGYGKEYVDLISCSTSTSGNQRTVNFVFHANTNWCTDGPLTGNDISGWTQDDGGLTDGWDNFDLNFGTICAPSVETNDATDIEDAAATFNGNLTNLGGAGSCNIWFVWDTSSHANREDYPYETTHNVKASTGAFSDGISGLNPDTTYHFRAIAENPGGIVMGEDKSFMTLPPIDHPPNTPTLQSPPNNSWVNTDPSFGVLVSDPDGDNVKACIDLDSDGSCECWSGFVSSGTTASCGVTMSDTSGRSWRAKAEDAGGLQSGWSGSWTIKKDTVNPSATLDQENGTSIDENIWVDLTESDDRSGVAQGDIDVAVDGGSWNHYSNTINDFIYTGSDGHSYEFRYRVQDNAGNWSDFSYDGSVTVSLEEEPPTYCSQGILTSVNLLSGLEVDTIDSFFYNASSLPDGTSLRVQFSQDNSQWYNSSGFLDEWDNCDSAGGAEIDLSGLGWSGPTNFYYKMEFNSTTAQDATPVLDEIKINYTFIVAPVVQTNDASNVEETTATLNGDLQDMGGAASCNVWFVYDTSFHANREDYSNEAPLLHDTKYDTGVFSTNIIGLNPGTTYHFRAVAENSDSIVAGDDYTFVTKPEAPMSLTAVAQSQTQINLTWTKGGGAEKTLILYRTDGNYPVSPSDPDASQVYFDVGESTSHIGLSCGITYYYRAWSYTTAAPNGGYSDGYSQDSEPTNSCNTSPVASMSCDPPGCSVFAGENLTLINESTDPDGQADIVKTEWDILETGGLDFDCCPTGCSSSDSLCDYTVQTLILGPGEYNSQIYVEDSLGLSDTFSLPGSPDLTIMEEIDADLLCSDDGFTWVACETLSGVLTQGDTMYFQDSSTPSEGSSIISWKWNLREEGESYDPGAPLFSTTSTGSTELLYPSNIVRLDVEDSPNGRSDFEEYIIGTSLPLPSWTEI